MANPPDSTIISTTYRYGSDLAQTVLPPVQAVVGAIPIAGTIIKGAIEGILSTLQLLDVIQPYSRVSFLLLIDRRRDTSRTSRTSSHSGGDWSGSTTIWPMHNPREPFMKNPGEGSCSGV